MAPFSWPRPQRIDECFDAGAAQFLTKPLDGAQLLRTIDQALNAAATGFDPALGKPIYSLDVDVLPGAGATPVRHFVLSFS